MLLREEELTEGNPRYGIAKAQERLCRRYRRLAQAGKLTTVVTAAIARELSGFVWSIAQLVILVDERDGRNDGALPTRRQRGRLPRWSRLRLQDPHPRYDNSRGAGRHGAPNYDPSPRSIRSTSARTGRKSREGDTDPGSRGRLRVSRHNAGERYI